MGLDMRLRETNFLMRWWRWQWQWWLGWGRRLQEYTTFRLTFHSGDDDSLYSSRRSLSFLLQGTHSRSCASGCINTANKCLKLHTHTVCMVCYDSLCIFLPVVDYYFLSHSLCSPITHTHTHTICIGSGGGRDATTKPSDDALMTPEMYHQIIIQRLYT